MKVVFSSESRISIGQRDDVGIFGSVQMKQIKMTD